MRLVFEQICYLGFILQFLGPRLVPTPRKLRILAWNLSHKLSFHKFPVPIQQRHLFPIIRALIAHLVNRLLARGLYRTLHNLLRHLWGVLDLNWLLLLILQYYPELLYDKVTEDITYKGLGKRGSFRIPEKIWHKYVPTQLCADILNFQPPPFRRPLSLETKSLLRALQRDSFLIPTPTPVRDTLTAFLRPKTAEKACFIANLRLINTLTPQPLPSFSLPSLEELASLLHQYPPDTFYGTTIDLTNFYWSLRLPQSAHGWFSFNNFHTTLCPLGGI